MQGLESKLNGKMEIPRINVQEQVGRETVPVYNFEDTPMYISFGALSHELWRRIGEIDPQRVRDSVNQ